MAYHLHVTDADRAYLDALPLSERATDGLERFGHRRGSYVREVVHRYRYPRPIFDAASSIAATMPA